MDKAQIDSLLIDAIAQNQILGNAISTAKIAKRLPIISAYAELENNMENSFSLCLSALNLMGSVIDSNEDKKIILAICGSGFANMNPAVIAISISDETILIGSAAKEGLIKQHTAEKAIERFKAEISIQDLYH